MNWEFSSLGLGYEGMSEKGPCPVLQSLHFRRPELKPVGHANQAVPCAMPGASPIYISSHLIPQTTRKKWHSSPCPDHHIPCGEQETD